MTNTAEERRKAKLAARRRGHGAKQRAPDRQKAEQGMPEDGKTRVEGDAALRALEEGRLDVEEERLAMEQHHAKLEATELEERQAEEK